MIKNQNAGNFYNPPADTLKACWDFYALEARGYYPSPVNVRRMWGAICNCNQANMLNPKRWYIYQSMGNWDITAQLAKVKALVLIIGGEEDEIPFESFEQWNNSLPNSTLLKIPKSAHFPHVDQPNAFFMAVELFMQNNRFVGIVIQFQNSISESFWKHARRNISFNSNFITVFISSDNRRYTGFRYSKN